jgi:hypothetical protein
MSRDIRWIMLVQIRPKIAESRSSQLTFIIGGPRLCQKMRVIKVVIVHFELWTVEYKG